MQRIEKSGRRILITGSAGKVGRIIWDPLKQEFDLWGIDIRAENTEREFRVDIRDRKAALGIVERLRPVDSIVHLAAVPGASTDWDSTVQTNILGTKNVYDAAKIYGVRQVVLASTVQVNMGEMSRMLRSPWGSALGRITPSGMVTPNSDYGLSKLLCESLARRYYERYGFCSVCLRIGWVARQEQARLSPYEYRIWLSHKDLIQLIRKSVLSDVRFGVYFGVSANSPGIFHTESARRDLGYCPVDGLALLGDRKRALWWITRGIAAVARMVAGERYRKWRDRFRRHSAARPARGSGCQE